MKNAGKACNNRLYRHIRTFEKIVKNYFVIYYKNSMVMEQEMQWNIMIKPLPLKFVVYLSKFVII